MKDFLEFIVIGAGKAGTTSLHEYLRQHPRITLPLRKETHFFICDKDSTPAPEKYYGRVFEKPIDNLNEYLAEFEKKPDAEIRGEVCPTYLFYPNAAINIKKYCPNAKILCILRNPVDRFYSNFNFRKIRKNDFGDFEKTLASIKDGSADIHTKHILDVGMYYTLLKRYYDLFPENQIKVFLFEELEKYPQRLMRDFMEFIGLPEFQFRVGEKFNRSGKYRFAWFYRRYQGSKLAAFIHRTLPHKVYQRMRVLAERVIFSSADSIKIKDRKYLQELYREDILMLQGLIKKDLSQWLV